MKFRPLLYVAASIFALSSCDKDKEGETSATITYPIVDTISVMAYNVAGLPALISSGKPETSTSEIGRRISAYDIVQVQEDFNYTHFLNGTSQHRYKTKSSGPVPLGDGLNTLSYYKVSDLKRFKWKDCTAADCLTPKGFTFSTIEIAPGETVDFYNIHANAGSGESETAARRKNLAQVFEYIKANSEGRPMVIMGDFNCRYTREADDIRLMFDLGLKDTWIELTRGGDVPVKGAEALTNCTMENSTNPNCETVDKIFYRSGGRVQIQALSFEKPRAQFSRDGEDLSDHIPVSAVLRFEIAAP